jgi:hypothetical protein
MDPDSRLRWAFRLANKLHRRTRKGFIQRELLFGVGECTDSLRLAESARILRNFRFIADSDIYPVPMPDGNQHVVVETRDDWSTRVDTGLRFDDGFRFEGMEVTEENLLGWGLLLRFFWTQDREQKDMGAEFQTPNLFGSRWDLRLAAGQTRTGNFLEESLAYPFVGEVGKFGARQTLSRRETLFSYSLGQNSEFSHVLVPFLDERADITVGIRLGQPGSLTLLGLGLSREAMEFRRFPTDLEFVRDRKFSDTSPADSAAIRVVQGQAVNRFATRANFFLGQRNLGFVKRSGLDALHGSQDIQVGTQFVVAFGRALRGLHDGNAPYPDDLHTLLSLFYGNVWEDWVLNAQLETEARQVFAGEGRKGGWRDVFHELDAYLYWQPGVENRHTFFFRASATGGWSVDIPYQLTLGGREGVRGYREDRFPGGHRILFSLEDRISVDWPAPELLDFGFTLFADLGQIRGGDAPFGFDSGWRGAIGAGIRFGLPPGTKTMTRIDLALPISHETRLKDLIFRVNLSEVLGLLPGVRDTQLLRSLRIGVKPEVITLPW